MHESVAVLGFHIEDLHVSRNLAQSRFSRELPGERELDRGEGELERAFRQGVREENPGKHSEG
jgi:hypothetical protein